MSPYQINERFFSISATDRRTKESAGQGTQRLLRPELWWPGTREHPSPGCRPLSVTIHVIDENDNAPKFSNETFAFCIAENEAPNSQVGRNAELTFSIGGQHVGGIFYYISKCNAATTSCAPTRPAGRSFSTGRWTGS